MTDLNLAELRRRYAPISDSDGYCERCGEWCEEEHACPEGFLPSDDECVVLAMNLRPLLDLVGRMGKALGKAQWQYDSEYETNRCAGCDSGDYGLDVHRDDCEVGCALDDYRRAKGKK